MANFIDERFYQCKECGGQEFIEDIIHILLKDAKGITVDPKVKPLDVSTRYQYRCANCNAVLDRGQDND